MNGWLDGWMDKGWMDGWMDELSGLWWDAHELLGWAAGQPWCSKWWCPSVEAQVTWLQGGPPYSTLFPTAPSWLLCQLHWPLSISSLPQPLWTAQRCCGHWRQPCKNGGVLCSGGRGGSPTPGGAESHLVGAAVTFRGWAVLSGHLPFWRANFPLSCQLLLPPPHPASLSLAWGGEEGPNMSWNHWVPYPWTANRPFS